MPMHPFKAALAGIFALALLPSHAAAEGTEVDINTLDAGQNQSILARVVVNSTMSESPVTYETTVSSIRGCFEHVQLSGEMLYNSKTVSAVQALCVAGNNGEILAAFRCHEKKCRRFK